MLKFQLIFIQINIDIYKIMQLLKLTSSFNASKRNCRKQNPKNYYLNILENCLHVPKDDKLIIRKNLNSLKIFDENNQIIGILNSHSAKGQTDKDKKLDVALRKIAQNLRKNELSQMTMAKPIEAKPKIANPVRQPPICLKGNYNNFNLMMQSLRSVSNAKSERRSQSHSQKDTERSLEKKKYFSRNASTKKYQSLRQGKKNDGSRPTFNSSFTTLKKPKLFMYESSNKSNKNKQCQTQTEFKLNFCNTLTGEKVGKLSRTSIEDIVLNNSKQLEQDKVISFQSFHIEKTQKPSIDEQQTDLEREPQNLSQQNFQSSFSNLPISNINILNQSISSLFSLRQYSSKSVHSELKEIKIISEDLFDYFLPGQTRQQRSTSSLSIPYPKFIDQLNQYIVSRHSEKMITCSHESVYIPFHTQYDLVTFEKLVQFLEEYTCPKYQNNPVRDLYTRIEIGVCGLSHMISTHKRINATEFKNFFEWKNPKVHLKFENMVKRCNRWGTFLTYWQMYWLKDCKQFQQFVQEFNQK